MEFLTGLQGTPAPTLILLGGFVFLFFGIATIKKPIVIEISTSGRKIALGLGALLVGAGLYLLISQQVEPLPPPATETPSPMPTSSPTNTLLPPTAASTPLPPIGLSVPTLQDAPEGQEFFFDTVVGGKGRDLTGYTLEIILEGADGRDAQLFLIKQFL